MSAREWPQGKESNEEEGALAKQFVERFNKGEIFYYEDSSNRWTQVDDLKYENGYLLVHDENSEKDSYHVVHNPKTFAQMQKDAAESGAVEYVKKVGELRKLHKTIDKSDTSIENKQRIFETYRPTVVNHVLEKLTGKKDFDRNRNYQEVTNDFKDWSNGERLDDGKRIIAANWTEKDFADMSKIFEEEEEKIRKQMIAEFKGMGIDVIATLKQIENAKKEEEVLLEKAAYLRMISGVGPKTRF